MYFRRRYKNISRDGNLLCKSEIIEYNDNFILIEIDKVPDTLKDKKIYKLIIENCKNNYIKNQIIPFPLELYKKELIISSLIHLVYTIENIYKIENNIPIMNYDFAIIYKEIFLKHINHLKKIYPNSVYLREINVLLNSKSLDELYYYIADNNYFNLLKYVIYKKNNILFI
jgi:hypothetical protein